MTYPILSSNKVDTNLPIIPNYNKRLFVNSPNFKSATGTFIKKA
jgi:hypothetical protein